MSDKTPSPENERPPLNDDIHEAEDYFYRIMNGEANPAESPSTPKTAPQAPEIPSTGIEFPPSAEPAQNTTEPPQGIEFPSGLPTSAKNGIEFPPTPTNPIEFPPTNTEPPKPTLNEKVTDYTKGDTTIDVTGEDVASDEPFDPATDAQNVYYSPGQMLEGQPKQEVATPEGWENAGSAFEIKRGKHEALIERVYSTELDGPRGEGAITANRTRTVVYGMIGLVMLGLVAIAIINATSILAPKQQGPADPLLNYQVTAENQLAKDYPSLKIDDADFKTTRTETTVNVSGNKLAFNNDKLGGELDDCANKKNSLSDMCYLGTTEKGLQLFTSVDIVHSPHFAQTGEYIPVELLGAKGAHIVVTMYAGNPTRFLVIVNDNHSGYVLQFPNGATVNDITGYATTLTVTGAK